MVVSYCLFLNVRDARTRYTNENDFLEWERIIWKKKGTKEEQSPWEGMRGWLLKSRGVIGDWEGVPLCGDKKE